MQLVNGEQKVVKVFVQVVPYTPSQFAETQVRSDFFHLVHVDLHNQCAIPPNQILETYSCCCRAGKSAEGYSCIWSFTYMTPRLTPSGHCQTCPQSFCSSCCLRIKLYRTLLQVSCNGQQQVPGSHPYYLQCHA